MKMVRAAEDNAMSAGVADHIEVSRKDFFKRDKRKYTGSEAWILSGNIDAIKRLGLKTSRRIHLMNGPIEAKFHKFEMYEGSL